MTQQYSNENKGALWKNDDKQSETHPDYKGSLNVNGEEFWVSAWINQSDNPKAPKVKFSITPKDEAHKRGMAQAKAAAAPDFNEDLNDSIPF